MQTSDLEVDSTKLFYCKGKPYKTLTKDIRDEKRRTKLLTDNPQALVKFQNVITREQNPKYADLNDVQQQRLHRVKQGCSLNTLIFCNFK